MGLLQNSANEKNEIDFPERGCLSHFLLEAEVVKKQIQQEQYTGKGGIYQQPTLPISENILIHGLHGFAQGIESI